MTARTFVVVASNGRHKLVRLEDVREVVGMMAVDELEERSGRCRGVVNLRGDIIPVFDACAADAALTPDRFILVAPLDGSHVGIVVDDVADILIAGADQVVARPVGPDRSVEMVRVDDELLPVLEPRDVVSARG